MKTSNGKKFDTIARQYKAMREKHPDRHIDYCIQQKTLAEAIEVAAKAIDDQNKIHNHQRHVGREKLNAFADQLKQKEEYIRQAKNFDELLSVVEAVKCERIGHLTHYDTATRIGAYLNIFPDKIYLHTGTRVGAAHLLGNINGRKFITLDELPKDFLKQDLTASEFEDILCIFKDNFKPPFVKSRQKTGRPC